MSATARRALAAVLGLGLVIAAWWWLGDGAPPEGEPETWRVTWVVDGDTLEAERGGQQERVRLIGIDTPERDQCGYSEARDALMAAVGDRSVELISGATSDTDSYGRLLRYVELDGEDVGLSLIEQGLAAARYDSRTGQPHPREDAYRAADAASGDLCR